MKIIIEGVEFSYRSVEALKDVTLTINGPTLVAIVGPNGSGKSTLLKCMSKILEPKRGSILINSIDIANIKLNELAKIISYVAPYSGKTFPITVFEFILMGRRPYVTWKCNDKDIEKVSEIIELLDLKDIAMRDFNELSSGQQQKVMIARALAQDTDVILLDEPTANLDIKHQIEVMELIKDLSRKRTVIIAIHDLTLVSRYVDLVVMLKDGKIVAVGSPREVLTPKNIEFVYGIKVKIVEVDGYIHIIPLGIRY
ncbi:MAG TPA: ABC transporter ATP-binding protein [Archaeoglobus profundus]|nr:ABC transporter ATP-binding protein [Archaeoglobus profundus]HIP58521.1 ABC transporter ATP-binding protein [Archaeoglobus profundus]